MFDLVDDLIDKKEHAQKFTKYIHSKYNILGLIENKDIGEYKALWKEYANFGLMKLPIPESDGGLGEDMLNMIAISEGIGLESIESGFMFAMNAHIWACLLPIYYFGSDKQKKSYLMPMMEGDIIGAHAISESKAGSDVYNLSTSFKEMDESYVLNGSKTFITNAPIADLLLVYARHHGTKGMKGICCFLVEKDTPGLFIGQPLQKMGLDLSFFSEIYLNNCVVPKSARLGSNNGGVSIFNYSMDYERPFLFSFQIGLMEKQLQSCSEYSRQRIQYNKPIREFQSISNKLADMKIRLEVSKLLCYKIATNKQKQKASSIDSSIAKIYISESIVNNCISAMEIYGAYGYTKEYSIERNLRDSFAGKIYSGTTDIQRNIISSLI